MEIAKVLCAAAILLGVAATGQATVTDLGLLVPGQPYAAGNSDLIGPFDDEVRFEAPAYGQVLYSYVQVNNDSFAIVPNGATGTGGDPHSGAASFAAAAGSNFFDIRGVGGTTRPGQYLVLFGYEPLSAAPEADTWLMLIVGAALLGCRLRLSW